MPCVRGEFHSRQILLEVCFYNLDAADDLCMCKALVDTGATNSCITKNIAEKIDVMPDGEKTVGGANGAYNAKTYNVGMFIPEISLHLDGIDVFEVKFDENDSAYQALLGMDILSRGHFQLDFSGHFIFCI